MGPVCGTMEPDLWKARAGRHQCFSAGAHPTGARGATWKMPGLTQPSQFSNYLSRGRDGWIWAGGDSQGWVDREDRGGLRSHSVTRNGGQGKIQTAISLSQTPGTVPGTSTSELTPVAEKLDFQKAAVKMQSSLSDQFAPSWVPHSVSSEPLTVGTTVRLGSPSPTPSLDT